jgi:ABC-2 type transport system ATP-binding protein
VEIRRRLGYLPQELGYHRHFTVAAFLDYVAILKEITDRRRRAEEVARVLAAVGLERRARTRIRALSGGMRQRLGIAQALLGQPDLLVLDEPTAGLDPEQRLRFRELLSDLPGDPVIVLSTHQADDIAAICPKVLVLLQGQVHFAGTPAELAATAAGRVWAADERNTRAHLSWRGGDNRWRHVGDDPPAGAELVAPTVEDGYLLVRSHAGRRQMACRPR